MGIGWLLGMKIIKCWGIRTLNCDFLPQRAEARYEIPNSKRKSQTNYNKQSRTVGHKPVSTIEFDICDVEFPLYPGWFFGKRWIRKPIS